MTADARMIFVNVSGSAARCTGVHPWALNAWFTHLHAYRAGISGRTAEVGEPILSTVVTVSHHEAKVATAALRAAPPPDRLAPDPDYIVRCCDDVDALIATETAVAYYSAWVIIETADID